MLSSQSQNPYVYCMNNPLRYVDPSGMMLTDDCINADIEANEALEQSLPSGPPAIDPIIDIIRDIMDQITPGGNAGNSSSNNDNNPYDDVYYDTSGDRTYSDDFGGPYSGSTGEKPSGIIVTINISGSALYSKSVGTATVYPIKSSPKDYVYEGEGGSWYPGVSIKIGLGLVFGGPDLIGKSYSSAVEAYYPLGGGISGSTNEDLSSRTLIFYLGVGTPSGKIFSASREIWTKNIHVAGWNDQYANIYGM